MWEAYSFFFSKMDWLRISNQLNSKYLGKKFLSHVKGFSAVRIIKILTTQIKLRPGFIRLQNCISHCSGNFSYVRNPTLKNIKQSKTKFILSPIPYLFFLLKNANYLYGLYINFHKTFPLSQICDLGTI